MTELPEDKLTRIVRYLSAHGMLGLYAEGKVTSRPHTDKLAQPEFGGLWAACKKLLEAGSQLCAGMKSAKTPFEVQFGMPLFDYLAGAPEQEALFGSFMKFMTDRVVQFIRDNHQFKPFSALVELGDESLVYQSVAGMMKKIL